MNEHCPDCGATLAEPRDLRVHWLRLLKCPRCSGGDFLEVGDPRWIYPLLRLEPGVLVQILAADDELLGTAIRRIRRIDFKTVSIVGFEHTLLGCYHPSRFEETADPEDPP